MRIVDMLRVGVVLNCFAIVTVTVYTFLLAPWVFHFEFGVVPTWAGNCTQADNMTMPME